MHDERIRLTLVSLITLILAGCTTLGSPFDPDHALKVRNGMTRDEVVAVMGSEPSSLEGSDPWKLVWIYSVADPISFGTVTERVSFTFDENHRVYGLPKSGGGVP